MNLSGKKSERSTGSTGPKWERTRAHGCIRGPSISSVVSDDHRHLSVHCVFLTVKQKRKIYDGCDDRARKQDRSHFLTLASDVATKRFKPVASQIPSIDGSYFCSVLVAEAHPAAPCRLRLRTVAVASEGGCTVPISRQPKRSCIRVQVWQHRALREHETIQTREGEVKHENTQCRRVAVRALSSVASAAHPVPPSCISLLRCAAGSVRLLAGQKTMTYTEMVYRCVVSAESRIRILISRRTI